MSYPWSPSVPQYLTDPGTLQTQDFNALPVRASAADLPNWFNRILGLLDTMEEALDSYQPPSRVSKMPFQRLSSSLVYEPFILPLVDLKLVKYSYTPINQTQVHFSEGLWWVGEEAGIVELRTPEAVNWVCATSFGQSRVRVLGSDNYDSGWLTMPWERSIAIPSSTVITVQVDSDQRWIGLSGLYVGQAVYQNSWTTIVTLSAASKVEIESVPAGTYADISWARDIDGPWVATDVATLADKSVTLAPTTIMTSGPNLCCSLDQELPAGTTLWLGAGACVFECHYSPPALVEGVTDTGAGDANTWEVIDPRLVYRGLSALSTTTCTAAAMAGVGLDLPIGQMTRHSGWRASWLIYSPVTLTYTSLDLIGRIEYGSAVTAEYSLTDSASPMIADLRINGQQIGVTNDVFDMVIPPGKTTCELYGRILEPIQPGYTHHVVVGINPATLTNATNRGQWYGAELPLVSNHPGPAWSQDAGLERPSCVLQNGSLITSVYGRTTFIVESPWDGPGGKLHYPSGDNLSGLLKIPGSLPYARIRLSGGLTTPVVRRVTQRRVG